MISANIAHPDPDSIDFSALRTDDLVNLCLQRSSNLKQLNVPRRKKLGADYHAAMLEFATKNRAEILAIVFDEICEQFDAIAPSLDKVLPKQIVDIGAGYAFVDLLLHRRFDCDVIIVDIEQSDDLHFGFRETGAGYSSLDVARKFLIANGVPKSRISILNPAKDDISGLGKVDVAISLISCGFHYPVNTYDEFFRENVGKAILLDIRKGTDEFGSLEKYGSVSEVSTTGRVCKTLCLKND